MKKNIGINGNEKGAKVIFSDVLYFKLSSAIRPFGLQGVFHGHKILT